MSGIALLRFGSPPWMSLISSISSTSCPYARSTCCTQVGPHTMTARRSSTTAARVMAGALTRRTQTSTAAGPGRLLLDGFIGADPSGNRDRNASVLTKLEVNMPRQERVGLCHGEVTADQQLSSVLARLDFHGELSAQVMLDSKPLRR